MTTHIRMSQSNVSCVSDKELDIHIDCGTFTKYMYIGRVLLTVCMYSHIEYATGQFILSAKNLITKQI